MTGVDINKIRHYAPGFNNRTTRLDADMSALLFKAGTRVISSSERLIADVSIKAAMGAGAPTDDKKRGLQSAGKSKYLNINGLVYDPTAKKQEGQFFKPWITERERINAMRSNDPVPNWGWVDRNPEHQNKLEAPRNSKGKVTRYPVNPKTGEPMKNHGFDQEFKSLGPTLGEKNPGGKLLARTAKAFGLVVDALGKFRCPPGTPAANRFTNERGEGCFDISVAQVRNLVGALTDSMQGPQSGSQMMSSLASAGVSIAEIRKSYKENGIAGLASLAERVGIAWVGEKWNDMSYVSQIPVRLREISGLTLGARERMERIANEKKRKINALAAKYDITETDEYKKIALIIEKMSADGDSVLDPDQFELLFRGGSIGSHEDWVVDRIIETHIGAISSKLGLDEAGAKEAYKEAKRKGEVTVLTQFIDAGLKRERDFRLGAFEDMLITADEKPHTFQLPNGKSRVYLTKSPHLASGDWRQYGKGGEAWPEEIFINSGPAILGFRDTPPPDYMDLYEATGGDIDDQWRAVASAMDADERLRAYATLYSTDLAATEGRGWRDFGAQTSAHERAHWGQMDAIFQHHVDTNPGVSIDSLTGEQLMDLYQDFMTKADPDTLRAVFGVDIEDLIDKRFDALAGAYSQAEQQAALKKLTGGGSAEDFNYARTLALMETLAELKANKSVGLIGDDPELDAILEKMDPLPPMTGGLISPSGGVIPSPPDGSPRPRFVPSGRTVPALPGSAPRLPANAGRVVTVTPGRSGGGGMGRIDADSPEWRDRAWRFLGRKSHFSDLIREGKLTDEDISDMIHGYRDPITGRKINGLLWQLQWEERMRVGTEIGSDNKKREYLKAAYEGMGITVDEIERIVLKIDNGEAIEESERESLLNAANHLRKTAIFHHAERDALLNQVEILKQRIGPFDVFEVTNPNIDPNRKQIIQDIARLEFEADSHYGAGMALTRGAMAKMEDLVDASDHRPAEGWKPGPRNPTRAQRGQGYSSELSSASHRNSAAKQSLKFSPEEKIAIDSISMKPLDVSVSTSSVNNLDELIENEENVMSVFERYNLPKPQTQLDSEVKKASTAMSAIEKTKTDTDLVVEMEIDTPEDYSPGAIFELDSISSTELITDLGDDIDERSPGFASRTKMPAAMAARMLSSSKSRKLLEKLGVPEERVDSVAFVGELAAAFSIGGPPGLLVVLGRRGGKDLGEYGIKIALEKGWITQDIADKARKFGLDRIASEGLPDEITDLASSLSSSVMTEKNKEAAREIVSAASEQIEILTSSTTRKAKEVAGSGKEKALELADSGIERAKKLRNRIRGGSSSPADAPELVSISGPQDARRVIDGDLPAAVKTEREAYTILIELAKMANEAKAAKEAGDSDVKIPNYDFCKVSIPGTNLFCGDSKGIPRKKMPQFSGEPTPGSPADSKPKNKKGEVDGTDDFIKHMEALGVKVEEKEVLASTLRASQNELVGEKVAGMMTNEDFDPAGEAIFVSRDGYVIDGHHRWAAQVGRDLEDGNIGDLPLNVRVVDMDIEEVLKEANKFAQEFGIAPKTAGNDAVAAKPAFINIQSPTDDIEEAKTTGRPLSVLRPGTMPTKSQKQYDSILETGGKDFLAESPMYKYLWRAVKEEYSALGFSEEEVEIINNGLREYLLMKTSLLQKERNEMPGTGWTKEEKFRESERVIEKADIVIAFPADLLPKLIADGRFKTQFETKTSGGALQPEDRTMGDIANFGYHPNTAPEMRPVYGYLTSGGTLDDNKVSMVAQYGNLQFVLKRDTHARSTYTTSDSLYSAAKPSPMGVPSGEAGGRVGDPMSTSYSEAQIHGGVSLDDVDYVTVNVDTLEPNDYRYRTISEKEFESISGMLAKVGIRVVPVKNGEIVDVWNGGKVVQGPEPVGSVV